MTALELFNRLAPLLGRAVEAEFNRRDLCILATRIAIDVGGYFRIEVKPLPVQVVLYNAAFAVHVDEGDCDVRKWQHDGSWSVGIGCGLRRPNGWDGHLIAVADGTFADFSIRQAERLERDIVTGECVIGPVPELDVPWRCENEHGTRIEYRRLDDDSYLAAPDWRDRHRRKRIVGDLIRQVR